MAKKRTKNRTWVWVDKEGDAFGIVHVWSHPEPPTMFTGFSHEGFMEELEWETALVLIDNLKEYEYADGPVEVQ